MDDGIDAVLTVPLRKEAIQAEELHWEEALSEVALDEKPFSHSESERISSGVVRGEDRDAELKDPEALLDGGTNAVSPKPTAASVFSGIQGVKYEDGVEESGSASNESYDSAVERMATSTPSVGSFKAQQAALRQLNEWHSGDSSLDSSLLDQFGEDEFKSHVIEIAEDRNLSAQDEVVQNMLDSLLPVVRERNILLNLARENSSLQALQECFCLPSDRAEVDLPEKEANRILGNSIAQGHYGNGEEQFGHDKLDICAAGYDGDVEGDVYAECQTNRMGPFSNGTNLKSPPDFFYQNSQKNDNDSPQHMFKQADHESSPKEDSSCSLPESDCKFFSESDECRNREEETDSIEPEAEVSSEKLWPLACPNQSAELSLSADQMQHDEAVATFLADDENTPKSCNQDFKMEMNDLPHKGASSSDNEQANCGKTASVFSEDSDTKFSLECQDFEPALEGFQGGTASDKVTATIKSDGNAELGRSEETEHCSVNSISETVADSAVDPAASPQLNGDESIEAPELKSELKDTDVSTISKEPSANNLLVSGANSDVLMETTAVCDKLHQDEGLTRPRQPAGLGRSVPSLQPASRVSQISHANRTSGSRPAVPLYETLQNDEETYNDRNGTREKLQMIRVKFLRLAHRLGQTADNVVVSQVLYRLGLAEQLRGGHSTHRSGPLSFERATIIAEAQEAVGQEELGFNCTIMLLGKTGVGKSATINSIFGEMKSGINAFHPATKGIQEITGTVHGIRVRIIDTPGLLPSSVDLYHNEKIMSSVKRFIKKSPPDIVLYLDRLDMQNRDHGDVQLLQTVTNTFGAALWFNAIVVLTHASSLPPESANGILSYETFVAQRSHMVQQTICQAAGDMRLMNPVALVENHVACRTNRAGQRILPNGQVWKPQLLLLCFASKILAEANLLLKLQDSSSRPFRVHPRVPPLPFLLSSLLQTRAQLKLPDNQMGDEDELNEEFEQGWDTEDDEDYEELPPFRHLTKEELALLDKGQRKTYFEELEYREKLFQKKQWKEELVRRKEMRKRAEIFTREEEEEALDERTSSVPVAMPDMALPPSFDSDYPIHRYRVLESASQWIVRPVLETHGWDHDNGYEGLNLEKIFALRQKYPVSISGQIMKDKKEASIQMECAASLRHGEGKVTRAGFDLQTIGKEHAYTLRSETRFSNFKGNKTTGGLTVTFFGEKVTAGMKVEDKLMAGRRLQFVLNGGAVIGGGDVAYGGSLEATLRDKDRPLGCNLSTLGLSLMNWHGDVAIGGNLQSRFVFRKTMMMARANLNNRGAGQVNIRASSSEELQMALIGIIPLLRALFSN